MDSNWPGDFAAAAADMAYQPDIESTLDRIVENARKVTSADEAGIFRTHGGGRIALAETSSAAVRRANELQLECQEGPCLQTIWSSATSRINDTRTDSRWPNWGPAVAELGWLSILSVRLYTPTRTLGALNLYSRDADRFDDDDAEIGEIFAQHASIALANSVEEDGLHRAIGARHLIGQAQGVLMERYDISADRAFTVLRRYSQDHNVKLRQVAQHVIEQKHLPEAEQPAHAVV